MPEFNIEDTEGIKEYVRSLDVYKQFDEVIVDQILQYTVMGKRPIEVEIKFFANDKLVYTHTERRLFTEPVVRFDHYFEDTVKDLSAAIIFGCSLAVEVDELENFMIFMDEFSSNLAVVKTADSQYTLRLNRNSENVTVASVSARYEIDCGDFKSSHEFKAKHAVKLNELKSVVEQFKALREQIVQKISI